MSDPRQRWIGLCLRNGATGDISAAFDRLTAAYETPLRAYHNLGHVLVCLAELESARELANAPDAMEFALWFHDAIYDSRAGDNEARSADLASAELAALGLDSSLRELVHRLVLVTRHSPDDPPRTADEQLIVDIDLAILGKPCPEFDRYEQQIREEYAWVPADIFCAKRAEVLQRFLARSPIYGTPHFRDRYESTARENLAASIANLTN